MTCCSVLVSDRPQLQAVLTLCGPPTDLLRGSIRERPQEHDEIMDLRRGHAGFCLLFERRARGWR
jgi:hypothetical protein